MTLVKEKRLATPKSRRPRLPDGEERILAKTACRLLNPPRPEQTVYNWMYRGIGGIFLEREHQGGLVYTSAEALERFLERTGQA